ncbi:MAG: AI-2E family transporter [Deltaproteobacteria bacterium]|nr:AI-2E family transporter [Deltaproteobacteria bacterium]
MNLRDFGGGFFLLCLAAALVFAYAVLRPFLSIFLLAVVLAVIARPAYAFLLARTRGRKALSSLLTCILVVLVIVAPLVLLSTLIAKESLAAYEWIRQRVAEETAQGDLSARLSALLDRYFPWVEMDVSGWGKQLAGAAGAVSQTLVSWSGSVLKTVTGAVWKFVLMLFALFYFLKDGDAFLRWLSHLLPLSASLEAEIAERFKEVSRSAFYGSFLTALAQGALGGIAFAIVGLPPLIWGVVMAFFSVIPMVGPAVVWLPASLLLWVSGRAGAAIFLAVWGVVVVGMSDNLLRPFFMRGKSELHPMGVFFSLIGGIAAFGMLGILLGPLAMVLVLTLLSAYQKAAKPVLDSLDSQ